MPFQGLFLLATTCLWMGLGSAVFAAEASKASAANNPLAPGDPTPGASPPPVAATEEEMGPLPSETPDAATEEKMKQAAERLLQQVNAARLSVAAKDTAQLSEHLAKAEDEVELLVTADGSFRVKQHIATARYHVGDIENYYFPIGPKLASYKELISAPDWAAANGTKAKDVDLVFASISVESDRALSRIREANAKLAEGDLAAAGKELDSISSETVKLEESAILPLEKTASYFALTNYFLAAGNFDDAALALHHAREGLTQLQTDTAGSAHKADIDKLLEQTGIVQTTLLKKDAALLETEKQHVEEWRQQVESWNAAAALSK